MRCPSDACCDDPLHRQKGHAMTGPIRPLTLALAFAALATPALASEQYCDDRDRLLAAALQHYGETVRHQAIRTDGRMLEVLASDGGSYTIVFTAPVAKSAQVPSGRISCVVDTGEHWHDVEPKPVGAPA